MEKQKAGSIHQCTTEDERMEMGYEEGSNRRILKGVFFFSSSFFRTSALAVPRAPRCNRRQAGDLELPLAERRKNMADFKIAF